MKFSFAHNNINVKDLDKSLAFYKEALLLEESRRLEDPSGAFTLVYLIRSRSRWILDRNHSGR